MLPAYHSSDSKKEQSILLRKALLFNRQFRSLSLLYKLIILLGLSSLLICIGIIWRNIVFDYELRRGTILYRKLLTSSNTDNNIVRLSGYSSSSTSSSSITTFGLSTSTSSSSITNQQQQHQTYTINEDTIPILIPVYSRPEYLRRVIDSLRKVNHINEVSSYYIVLHPCTNLFLLFYIFPIHNFILYFFSFPSYLYTL